MKETRPFMLLRARVKPEALDAFDAWFHQAQLRDVRQIPGVVRARAARTAAGTYLGIYEFEASDVLGPALGSPEADGARAAWSRWASHLEELGVEIMAPLLPLPMYESPS